MKCYATAPVPIVKHGAPVQMHVCDKEKGHSGKHHCYFEDCYQPDWEGPNPDGTYPDPDKEV